MTGRPPSDAVLRRWRANLDAAGIAAPADEIDAVIAEGRLALVEAFERLDDPPAGAVPDHFAALPPPGSAAESESDVDEPLAPARDPIAPVERTLASALELDRELNLFQTLLTEPALAAARRRRAELASGNVRSALHGVPVAVKGLFAMRGVANTAGSRTREDAIAHENSAAVTALEEAGAVIVGLTRMSELAYFPGSANPHYGPTKNPHDRARDTGGSSSGSAGAVAAGLVSIAIGSDTGGSIRIPASACGVVGLKPTFGRVSLHGAVPLSWSMDHAGPLTRTVADAAIALELLAGRDPRDPRTMSQPDSAFAWSRSLARGVDGLRVAVVTHDGTETPVGEDEARAAVRAAASALAAQGARLTETALPEMAPLRTITYAILALEAAEYHAPALRARLGDFGVIARRRLLAAHALGPAAFTRAQRIRGEARRAAGRVFERADLLVLPTLPGGAVPLGEPASTDYTSPFNALGWPAISVPCGRTPEELPLGVQIVAAPWREDLVLRAAAVVESAATVAARA